MANGNGSKVIKAVGSVDKWIERILAAPTVKLLVIGVIALMFYMVNQFGNDIVEVMKDNNAKITDMVMDHEERLQNSEKRQDNSEKVIADLAARLEDRNGE